MPAPFEFHAKCGSGPLKRRCETRVSGFRRLARIVSIPDPTAQSRIEPRRIRGFGFFSVMGAMHSPRGCAAQACDEAFGIFACESRRSCLGPVLEIRKVSAEFRYVRFLISLRHAFAARKRLRHLAMLLDELQCLPAAPVRPETRPSWREGADLLFSIVAKRGERGSTVLTGVRRADGPSIIEEELLNPAAQHALPNSDVPDTETQKKRTSSIFLSGR